MTTTGTPADGSRVLPEIVLGKQRTKEEELLAAAEEEYSGRELPIIPLDGKKPAIRAWQAFVADAVKVRFWFGERGCNIGLRTAESGYIVVDTDTAQADQYVLAHLPESPMQALSGSGSKHHHYRRPPRKEIRNRQGWKRIHGLDIRGHGGFIVLPPSIHPETGWPYRWLGAPLPAGALPVLSPAFVYERTRKLARQVLMTGDKDIRINRARRYIAYIKSIQGQNGSNACFRAVCKLRDFGLSAVEAWPLLLDWNETNCLPRWSEQELRHKIESVYGQEGSPLTAMLVGRDFRLVCQ